jgi:hypothetical protein
MGQQDSTGRRGRTLETLVSLSWRWSPVVPLMAGSAARAVWGATQGRVRPAQRCTRVRAMVSPVVGASSASTSSRSTHLTL